MKDNALDVLAHASRSMVDMPAKMKTLRKQVEGAVRTLWPRRPAGPLKVGQLAKLLPSRVGDFRPHQAFSVPDPVLSAVEQLYQKGMKQLQLALTDSAGLPGRWPDPLLGAVGPGHGLYPHPTMLYIPNPPVLLQPARDVMGYQWSFVTAGRLVVAAKLYVAGRFALKITAQSERDLQAALQAMSLQHLRVLSRTGMGYIGHRTDGWRRRGQGAAST